MKLEVMQQAYRVALLGLILGVCPLAPAQNSKPPVGDQPVYRTRSQEVVVDVVVGPDGKKAPPS